VFNGAICSAAATLGCGQTPATIAVGSSGNAPRNSSLELAIDQPTNTIYAANLFNTGQFSPPPFLGNSVDVIDGATCDAKDTSGWGQTPATVTLAANPPVGSNPAAIAFDQSTDTIYTANIADGENPGTVSVINGATCNAQDTSGCAQTPATAPAGFGATGLAIDHAANKIYVTNDEDTSVSVTNGDRCNGSDTAGCSQTPTKSRSATTQSRSQSTPRPPAPTSPTSITPYRSYHSTISGTVTPSRPPRRGPDGRAAKPAVPSSQAATASVPIRPRHTVSVGMVQRTPKTSARGVQNRP
jgi:DNA-binding beta-propeller fold protein YncE